METKKKKQKDRRERWMGFVLLHPPPSLFHDKVDEGSQLCLSSL